MLQALFGEIKGFFDKDFLFASFLPSLVFLVSIAATLGGVVGFEGSLGWADSFTGLQSTAAVGVIFLGTVVFAYIVNSLRMVFLKLWAGGIKGLLTPLLHFGEQWHRTKFDMEVKASYRIPEWPRIVKNLEQAMRHAFRKTGTGPVIPDVELENLLNQISKADLNALNTQGTMSFLQGTVLPVYQKFVWSNELNDIYQLLHSSIQKKAGDEQFDIIKRRFRLDRLFGTKDTIRASALGNIVESYNAYPFKRYGMEGEIFWPHLQHFVPDDFLKRVREQRIVFDFCLTMATLGVFYGFLVVVGGPIFWSNVWYWLVLGLFAVVFSYTVYYRLAVFVATQYGDLIRSSFDLFRHKLLNGFSVKLDNPVITLLEERKIWEELSRLLAYGDPVALNFETSKPSQMIPPG